MTIFTNAADKIIANLGDRGGFDFGDIDGELMAEIRQEIAQIVEEAAAEYLLDHT